MKKLLYKIKNCDLFLSIKDIYMFFKFRRTMKYLEKHNDEVFFKYGFATNMLGNIVYTQLNLTEKEIAEVGYNPIAAVQKKITPHIDFMCDYDFGDYLTPQISNFQDEEGNVSLSYLVLYMFTPLRFSFSGLFKGIFYLALLSAAIYLGYLWYTGTFM